MKLNVVDCQEANLAHMHRGRVHLHPLPILVILALFTIVLLFPIFPAQAYARGYSCPSVNIDATVNSDGSLAVTETREFAFDGEFTAVWWSLNNLPSDECEVTIDGVTLSVLDDTASTNDTATTDDANASDDTANESDDEDNTSSTQALEEVTFKRSWREEGGPGVESYSFDEDENTVYVFFDASNTSIAVTLSYTITNFVQVYSDVADLTWQFVGSNWSADSDYVTATIHLPASGSVDTSSDDATVRAWAHGVTDSTVDIQDDGSITIAVPTVSAGGYAEIHAVFPAEWMTNVSATSSSWHTEEELDSVLESETRIANQDSAQRLRSLVLIMVCLAISIGAIVWALVVFFRHGRERRPAFQERYWRDVPNPNMHPATLGRLWRWNSRSSTDFTATLIYLSYKGVLRIDAGSYQVPNKPSSESQDSDDSDSLKTVNDYYLTRLAGWQDKIAESPIDIKAIELLFDEIAEGADSLWFGTVNQFAQEHPHRFVALMDKWQSVVNLETKKHNLFKTKGARHQGRMIGLGIVVLIAGILASIILGNLIPLVALAPAAVVLIVVGSVMSQRNEKAVEIYAKCEALCRWLKDFGTLDEHLTTDGKRWSALMVCACVFDVADQAFETLTEELPSVVTDSDFMPVASWMTPRRCSADSADSEETIESPMDMFSEMQANLIAVAQAATKTTDMSKDVSRSKDAQCA